MSLKSKITLFNNVSFSFILCIFIWEQGHCCSTISLLWKHVEHWIERIIPKSHWTSRHYVDIFLFCFGWQLRRVYYGYFSVVIQFLFVLWRFPAFNAVMEYFYCDDAEVTGECAIDLLIKSRVYGLDRLFDIVETIVGYSIDSENVACIYEVVITHSNSMKLLVHKLKIVLSRSLHYINAFD
jgi:hypothetical protein